MPPSLRRPYSSGAPFSLAAPSTCPTRYSVAVISEGARMLDGAASEKGAPDEYGRRRLGGIGETLGEACKAASAEGVIVQNLAYLMRSGPPDATDRQVAYIYGALAVELLAAGHTGRMCALVGGRFTDVPIDTLLKGEKRVDVARHYDGEVYRPRIAASGGLSVFGF